MYLYAICTQFHDDTFSGVSETTTKLDKNLIYVSRSRTLMHFSKWLISKRLEPKRMVCTKFHCCPFIGFGETLTSQSVS